MSFQPASRTRFYRDKRHGKVMGVCSGIANYTGLDVTLVRIMMAAAALTTGVIIPLYFIAGWIADDQPRELALDSKEDRRFWQGVRASPAQTAREIRSRLREIDRRLGDVEQYVTTANRRLAREIEQLR